MIGTTTISQPQSALDSCIRAQHSYGALEITRYAAENSFVLPVVPSYRGLSMLLLSAESGSVRVVTGNGTFEIMQSQLTLTNHRALVEGEQMDLFLVHMPESSVVAYCETTMDAVYGRIISSHHGVAQLVAHLVEDLGMHQLVREGAGRIAEHVMGLVGLMCAETAGSLLSTRDALLHQAKQYIEAHLGEIGLSPASVAGAMNVSTRTLHRLFASEGSTVAGWMRERRLEHCRMDILDPRFDDLTIASIAAQWGLCDAAHFSRLFKQSFGLSPRGYRAINTGVHQLQE